MSTGRSFARTGVRTELMRSIPKVELHCHLLGTIRKSTMREIARANGATTTDAEIEQFYVRGDKPVGVLRIFRELEAHILQQPRDLYRIAYEYIEGLVEHNVRHAEVFWSPTGTLEHTDHSLRALQDAVVEGLHDAQTDHRISSVLIPSIDREASPQAANELVTLMTDNRSDRVLGLGIDYRENDRPADGGAAPPERAAMRTLTRRLAGSAERPYLGLSTDNRLLRDFCASTTNDLAGNGSLCHRLPWPAGPVSVHPTAFACVSGNIDRFRTLAGIDGVDHALGATQITDMSSGLHPRAPPGSGRVALVIGGRRCAVAFDPLSYHGRI
jgi:hypothetical protein